MQETSTPQQLSLLSYDPTGLSPESVGPQLGIDAREQYSARLSEAAKQIEAAHASKALGFLTCIDDTQLVTTIGSYAQEILDEGRFTDQIVIGIGGSSLGGRAVLASAQPKQCQGLRTHFSENIDPVTWRNLLDSLDLSTTLVVVITKSGSTIETMSKFWIVWDALLNAYGPERAATHVVAITDPTQGGLRAMVDTYGWMSFPVPANVGGRFSVLTAVGLVPLALAGYPIEDLLDGARAARDAALNTDMITNACAQAALDQILLFERGITQVVMMSYSDILGPMADWFAQIWGESLGKKRGDEYVGITPIKALGVIDQHSQVQLYMEGPRDKHIMFVRVAQHWSDDTVPSRPGLPASLAHLAGRTLSELMDAELQGTYLALRAASRPTSMWTLPQISPHSIGAFILSWEYITALSGALLGVDAFNQPGVELGKKIAHGLLGKPECVEIARQYTQGEGSKGTLFEIPG